MIEQLEIRDLGVIAQASLPFSPGFTVLTGETGAGKTMVVTALGLLLGERAETTRVRQGAPSSWVEGRFLVGGVDEVRRRVDELGGALDDGELILSRQVSVEGRSKAVIGGRAAPVSALSELGEHLVVVHGQSDQVRLKSESAQRHALDRFAGSSLQSLLREYGEVFLALNDVNAQIEDMTTHQVERQQEMERLERALDQIGAVRPVVGEDEKLKALTDRLEHVEELRLAASAAKEKLSTDSLALGDSDARSGVDHAIRSLERVIDRDSGLAPALSALREAAHHIDEANQTLSSYLASLTEGDSLDLDEVMNRRAALTQLMREYGPTLEEVLEFEKTASDRILQLDVSEGHKQQLEAQRDSLLATRDDLAAKITELRVLAARDLSARVTEELVALAMSDAQFTVSVSPREHTITGADQVVFNLVPHRGAQPVALAKGASGGELSRVMLALEVVIAQSDPVPTFIFDEVDAGVGGQTALEIGRRLARLAETAQVICVTHLAQVAACADNHLRVIKNRDGEFTESSVQVLQEDDRLEEIARMLGGDAESESAREHAAEMLQRESVSRSGAR